MTVKVRTLPLSKSRVYMWAYKFKRILTTKGLEEAQQYAQNNIPKQFNHQIDCIIEGVYI